MYPEAFFFGLLGLIVGSFLNVVILRHGVRTLHGRSGCMACRRQLRWYDMIPVFSWLFLRGKCRTCRAKISIQYPLVEAATAVLFIVIGLAPIGPFIKAIDFCIAGLLVCIAVYDMRHTIIPDEWAYSFAALAFIVALAGIGNGGDESTIMLTVLAGPIAAVPLFALWAVSRGKWMGLGDPKLALGIGWFLGPVLGPYTVFLAFVIGALVSVCVILPVAHLRRASGIIHLDALGPGLTMKSEVPFGPFLIASCILVWCASVYGLPLPFFAL